MAGFVAVMSWDANNRVTKYADFPDKPGADAHVAAFAGRYPGAFVAPRPGAGPRDWRVNPPGKTISVDPRAPEPPQPDTPTRAAIKRIANEFPANVKAEILAALR